MRPRIILIWLLFIAFLLTLIRHRIRYILIIPVALIAIFTLGTIIFPLYQQWPNFISFYKNQPSILYISPSNEQTQSSVTIQSNWTLKKLEANQPSTSNLQPSTNTVISFVSPAKNDNTSVFLLLPEWTTIQLSPQSQITFLSQYPKIFMTTKEWQATASASNNYSPRQLVLSGVSKNGASNEYQQAFEKTKLQAIWAQANAIFMQNATLKAINKWILKILARVRPTKFQDSLKNFTAFETFIPTEKDRTTDTTVDPKIGQDMINQAWRGLEETQLYQRWKKLFN